MGWVGCSVTRLSDFLHFGQLFKAQGTIILTKLLTLLGNSCKGVKILHFSSEIIFGQLLQTFGDFYWSHWLGEPSSLSTKEFPASPHRDLNFQFPFPADITMHLERANCAQFGILISMSATGLVKTSQNFYRLRSHFTKLFFTAGQPRPLFLYITILFKYKLYRKKLQLQQELNLDRRSRGQAR